MSKTEVFPFTVRDHEAASTKVVAHTASLRFIELAKGTIVDGSRREIDSSLVDERDNADVNVQPGHTSRPKSELALALKAPSRYAGRSARSSHPIPDEPSCRSCYASLLLTETCGREVDNSPVLRLSRYRTYGDPKSLFF